MWAHFRSRPSIQEERICGSDHGQRVPDLRGNEPRPVWPDIMMVESLCSSCGVMVRWKRKDPRLSPRLTCRQRRRCRSRDTWRRAHCRRNPDRPESGTNYTPPGPSSSSTPRTSTALPSSGTRRTPSSALDAAPNPRGIEFDSMKHDHGSNGRMGNFAGSLRLIEQGVGVLPRSCLHAREHQCVDHYTVQEDGLIQPGMARSS